MTYIDACLAGEIEPGEETINEVIEVWHTSPTDDGPLVQFLGMTEDEYAAWAECRSTVVEIVSRRKDAAIAAQYGDCPGPRAMLARGMIDEETCLKMERDRDAGPPTRPFAREIAALRNERTRQGLSKTDIAKRLSISTHTIKMLELGLNKNPDRDLLVRYATAMGVQFDEQPQP